MSIIQRGLITTQSVDKEKFSRQETIPCNLYRHKSSNIVFITTKEHSHKLLQAAIKNTQFTVFVDNEEFFCTLIDFHPVNLTIHSMELVSFQRKDFQINKRTISLNFCHSKGNKFTVFTKQAVAKKITIGEIEALNKVIDLSGIVDKGRVSASDISSKFMGKIVATVQ